MIIRLFREKNTQILRILKLLHLTYFSFKDKIESESDVRTAVTTVFYNLFGDDYGISVIIKEIVITARN